VPEEQEEQESATEHVQNMAVYQHDDQGAMPRPVCMAGRRAALMEHARAVPCRRLAQQPGGDVEILSVDV
jgi:hypothetical protein